MLTNGHDRVVDQCVEAKLGQHQLGSNPSCRCVE